jgi:hypothetical protein
MWQLGRGDDHQHKMIIKRKQGSITKDDDQEDQDNHWQKRKIKRK